MLSLWLFPIQLSIALILTVHSRFSYPSTYTKIPGVPMLSLWLFPIQLSIALILTVHSRFSYPSTYTKITDAKTLPLTSISPYISAKTQIVIQGP